MSSTNHDSAEIYPIVLSSNYDLFYHTCNMQVLAPSYNVTRNDPSCRTCSTPVPPASELALVVSLSSNEDFQPAYILHRSWLPLGPCRTSLPAERTELLCHISFWCFRHIQGTPSSCLHSSWILWTTETGKTSVQISRHLGLIIDLVSLW